MQTIRVQKGLTVRELGDACGLAFTTISKIENGKYNVSVDILGKVADALGYKLTFEPKEEDKRVLFRKLKEQKKLLSEIRELKEEWDKGVVIEVKI